jgi:sialate O-acetylesterase
VSTADLVPLQDAANIHPPLKKPIGSRLANLALVQTYMLPLENVNSPRFAHYEIQGNTCILYFDNATTGLTGNTLDTNVFTGFEIADSSKRFTPITATIGPSPNSLILTLPAQNFGQLKAIRYCFKNYEASTIFNMSGLPIFPFRTDDWE